MSYYEYECTACRTTFTVEQTYREHDQHQPVQCPKCGATKTHQIIANVHVVTSKKS